MVLMVDILKRVSVSAWQTDSSRWAVFGRNYYRGGTVSIGRGVCTAYDIMQLLCLAQGRVR